MISHYLLQHLEVSLNQRFSTFMFSEPILFGGGGGGGGAVAGYAQIVKCKDSNFTSFKKLAESQAH